VPVSETASTVSEDDLSRRLAELKSRGWWWKSTIRYFWSPDTACSHLPGSVGDHPHSGSSPHIVILKWSCHFTCKYVLRHYYG
jgi:hypothetical protein